MTPPCPTAEALIIEARQSRQSSPAALRELKRLEREHVRIGAEHYREAARIRKRIKQIQKAAKPEKGARPCPTAS